MLIERFVLGAIQTNTYIISIDNKAIVIDPASKADKIISLLNGKELLAVLLTHGHFDHIKACDGLFENYHCPIYIHEADEDMTRDKRNAFDYEISVTSYISCPLIHLKEGKMKIGPFEFEVLFTPGHSKGSVCYVFEDDIFTGDTLFKLSIGRTDFKGGSEKEIKESLRLIKNINKDLIVHPGHEEETNLLFEIANNMNL